MKTEWTKEFPKEPGRYWLCGKRFSSDKVSRPAKLHMVTVFKTANSLAYTCDGAFLYPSEGMEGLWTPAVIPDLPKIEPHFYRRLQVFLKKPLELHVVDDVDYEKQTIKTRAVDAPAHWGVWRSFDAFKFARE